MVSILGWAILYDPTCRTLPVDTCIIHSLLLSFTAQTETFAYPTLGSATTVYGS